MFENCTANWNQKLIHGRNQNGPLFSLHSHSVAGQNEKSHTKRVCQQIVIFLLNGLSKYLFSFYGLMRLPDEHVPRRLFFPWMYRVGPLERTKARSRGPTLNAVPRYDLSPTSFSFVREILRSLERSLPLLPPDRTSPAN